MLPNISQYFGRYLDRAVLFEGRAKCVLSGTLEDIEHARWLCPNLGACSSSMLNAIKLGAHTLQRMTSSSLLVDPVRCVNLLRSFLNSSRRLPLPQIVIGLDLLRTAVVHRLCDIPLCGAWRFSTVLFLL